ncbi:hypothetical protein [Clostridium sp. YIM B02551]|uniref:hypothetical protein n=1 Tax=Clostridium sp. YIM B02551 TaxID=2910679 RepID=UPI001EEB8EB1|nr:hypothetical protein [Clostridium sp. YIM B02551]
MNALKQYMTLCKRLNLKPVLVELNSFDKVNSLLDKELGDKRSDEMGKIMNLYLAAAKEAEKQMLEGKNIDEALKIAKKKYGLDGKTLTTASELNNLEEAAK